MDVLNIRGLSKSYGRITAVDNLSLNVERGVVFGLLGPNGSGKTTTLGMILGVTIPTAGDYQWFGESHSHHHRKRIGSILEKPNFYPSFSGYRNLALACKIKQVKKERIGEVLDLVGLTHRKNDPFKTYSLGMKQRLAIASALLAEPEVMILDEPTNGLDPEGIAEIRQLIREIADTGKTIVLASHLLDEVQKVCSDFAILKNGKLIHTGKVDSGSGDEVIIEVAASDMDLLTILLKQFEDYVSHEVHKDLIEVRCSRSVNPAALNEYLMQSGIFVHHLSVVKKKLEQQFMEILSSNA